MQETVVPGVHFLWPNSMLFLTVNGGERPSASSAHLAQDVVHDAQELVRLNIQLAKQEVRELLLRNGIAIGLLAFGALLLALAILVALPAFLVVLWSNHLIGAAIWLGGYAVIGALLALVGKLRLRIQPPQRTLTSLEETRDWALRQIRSSDRS